MAISERTHETAASCGVEAFSRATSPPFLLLLASYCGLQRHLDHVYEFMTWPVQRSESTAGVFYALAAFLFWGANPIYFKAVAHIPAFEILAHRVVWSVVLVVVIVTLAKRWRGIVAVLGDRRTLLMLMLSTVFVSTNWFIYIWAIAAERMLETSLGYYINPLVNVLLGVVILQERLNRWQALAVGLAAIGVFILALRADQFPWVALVLAGSFALYGLIRKTVRVGSVDGLAIETMLILPIALGYLIYLGVAGSGQFGAVGLTTDALLAFSGVVTAVPLIWFASAARRMSLSAVGMFQYIAPTLQFLLAVFIYDEPFTTAHLICFLFVWSALILFASQSLRAARRQPA